MAGPRRAPRLGRSPETRGLVTVHESDGQAPIKVSVITAGSRNTGPDMTETNRSHLTIADVCGELGVARSTFYDWRASRKAPKCIKLPNGEIRIRRVDLERWLQSLEDVRA